MWFLLRCFRRASEQAEKGKAQRGLFSFPWVFLLDFCSHHVVGMKVGGTKREKVSAGGLYVGTVLSVFSLTLPRFLMVASRLTLTAIQILLCPAGARARLLCRKPRWGGRGCSALRRGLHWKYLTYLPVLEKGQEQGGKKERKSPMQSAAERRGQ